MKPIRLKGKALAQLNQLIHDRDKYCVMCGQWVENGAKAHHVVFKSQGGSDTADNEVLLCISCHGLAHGPHAKGIRERLQNYLRRLNNGM